MVVHHRIQQLLGEITLSELSGLETTDAHELAQQMFPQRAAPSPSSATGSSGTRHSIHESPMTVQTPIYMDNSATTRCDPRVVDKMLPFFAETFGNAASRNHPFGWAAEAAVDEAREQVAKLIGAHPKEIIWTSGSTEANNLAIKGVAEMYSSKGRHMITCVTEHKAVIDPMKRMEQLGWTVTWLEPDRQGRVDLDALRAAIREDTVLISLMAANNEIGTAHPLAEIGAIAKETGVLFHTDATQAAGRMPLDVDRNRTSTSCRCRPTSSTGRRASARSTCAARAPRVRLTPILDGGGHERGMRSGTLNVTGIVGMGEAARIALEEFEARTSPTFATLTRPAARTASWPRSCPTRSSTAIDDNSACRSLINISFPYVEGESLIMGIKDVAVSSGSACTSASLEPSYVLKSARPRRRARPQLDPILGRAASTPIEEVDFVDRSRSSVK